jgi:transglutaminase-like putative cysteine protease
VCYQTDSNANDKLTKRVFSILNAFLGIFASFNLFQSFFNIQYSGIGVFAMILFSVSLFSSIYIIGKYANFAFIPIALSIFIVIRSKGEMLLTGVSEIIKQVVDGKIGDYDAVNSLIMFVLFLSGAIVTFFTVYHPNGICEMLLSVPVLIAGILFEREVNYFWLILVICHIIITFVMQIASYYQYADTGKSNFVRMGDSFYAKSNFKVNVAARAGLIASGIAFVIISLTAMYINTGAYERPERVKILRSNLIDAGKMFDSNDIGGSLKNFGKAFGKNGLGYIDTSQHGNLGLTGEGDFLNIPVAEIITSKLTKPLYLKQWVGTEYTGKSFESLPKSAYDSMPDLKISPQEFYETYCKEYYGKDYVNGNQVYVNYHSLLKGNHEAFLPDFILEKNDEFTPLGDTTFKAPDNADYELYYTEYDDSYYAPYFDKALAGENYDEDLSDLTKANDEYRDWVYDNYLSLPDTEAIENIREKSEIDEWINDDSSSVEKEYTDSSLVGKEDTDYPTDTFEKLENIRTYLQEDRYYSLDAGVTPKNEDFVDYFLFTQKKGSCTYFASSGVVLSRMAGIPARYCDGLVVFPDDYQQSKDYVEPEKYGTKYRTMTLNDTRFHAWVEVFVDGQGWVPYEFTPGYDEGNAYAENPPTPPAKTDDTDRTTSVTTRASGSVTSRNSTISTSGGSTTSLTTTKSVTAAAAVTPKKPPINKTLIFAILLIIAAIALPVLLILLRRIKLRGRYFSDGENNHRVLVYYLYMIDLLKFIGIERGSKDYPDFANELENDFAPHFKQATDIALKAKYSNYDIENEEVERMKSTSETLSKELFGKQKKTGRFNMWLNGLV